MLGHRGPSGAEDEASQWAPSARSMRRTAERVRRAGRGGALPSAPQHRAPMHPLAPTLRVGVSGGRSASGMRACRQHAFTCSGPGAFETGLLRGPVPLAGPAPSGIIGHAGADDPHADAVFAEQTIKPGDDGERSADRALAGHPS